LACKIVPAGSTVSIWRKFSSRSSGTVPATRISYVDFPSAPRTVFSECSHNARNAAVRLHPLRVSPTAAIFVGILAAATSPIRPTTARAIIASA
jgi:hypothetical protein